MWIVEGMYCSSRLMVLLGTIEVEGMGRPRKFRSPVRYSFFVEREELDRLSEIADVYGDNLADLIRKALLEFTEKNRDCMVYSCECGFFLKISNMTPAMEEVIKEHERDCKHAARRRK